MYKYFISYNYTTKNGSGFGYCDVTTNKKIDHFELLESIAESIKEKCNFKGIAILNYKLLKKKK